LGEAEGAGAMPAHSFYTHENVPPMNHYDSASRRAAVIIPPIRDFYRTAHRMSALGAKIVCRIIGEAGFEVRLIDGSYPADVRQLPLPKSLMHLSGHCIPNETGKCSFFTGFRHFGRDYPDIIEEIVRFDPHICFVACFAYCYSEPLFDIANLLKERLPRVAVVAGGAGVSVYPDYFLRHPSIDFTLSGEAEITLPPFLEFHFGATGRSPADIPYIGWKHGSERFHSAATACTTGSTLIPIVEKSGEHDNRVFYTASLSRGCPASCRFCSNFLAHGRTFRHGPVEQFDMMLNELPALPADHSICFNFEDDNLMSDFSFFREILSRCRSHFPNATFTAENGLDYRLMSPEQCGELITAGFRQFNFTLGSTSATVLNAAARSTDIERFDDLLTMAAQHSIEVISYIICGFPDDTVESIASNLRFLMHRKATIGVSMFYPVPGIAGFENRSFFDGHAPQRCAGASAYPWGGSVDTVTLVTAFRLARFLNLMKSAKKTAEEHILIGKTMHSGRLHTIVKEHGRRKIIEVPLQDTRLTATVLG
jgi:hypothetical protein